MSVACGTGFVRIACHQLAPVIGELETNRRLIGEAVADALRVGTDVLVLPELATSGYLSADAAEARGVSITPEHGFFAETAASLAGSTMVVVTGFSEDGGDVLCNSAAVIDASGILAVYRKTHLWDREILVFTPGDTLPPVVETVHGRIGLLICCDLEFPEMPRLLALAGAELIAVPTNWPAGEHPEAERAVEVIAAQAAARTNGVFIACCDRWGVERDQEWNEATAIVDRFGWILAEAGRATGGTETASAQVSLHLARDEAVSPRNHLLRDRRPALYARVGPGG